MLVVVNFNPAIDCTARIDTFVAGGLNRIQDLRHDAGGKGINVSKTLQALGCDHVLCGFIGTNDQIFQQCFNDWKINYDFVTVDGLNRTNLKVMSQDGSLTEINQPSFYVPKIKQEELRHKVLSYVKKDTVVVISGSLPKNVTSDYVVDMMKQCKQLGAKVIFDGDGEMLEKGIQCQPTLIKPNIDELQRYFKINRSLTKSEIITCGKKLIAKGVESVCVSCGKDGAILVSEKEIYTSNALKVEVKSTVGAGDAMVAAFAMGLETNLSKKDSFILAIACSAAEVTQEGTQPGSKELVMQLKHEVEVEKIA